MSWCAMCCVRGPSACHRQKLGTRVDGQPKPLHLTMAAQPGSQFVQLDVWEVQVAEAALMQELRMLTRASEPPRDGRLTGAQDPRSRQRVEPFSQRREDHG